jgi:NADH dehydrogenase FAD-containing subunit
LATYKTSTGLRTEGTISYDYFIAASGLRRQWPVVPQSLEKEAYIEEVTQHISEVSAAADGVVVIGGGAVGIEMAAELKEVFPKLKVTLIHSRAELLSSEPLPVEFRSETLRLLEEQNVDVLLSKRVSTVEDNDDGTKTVVLDDKTSIKAGKVIWALSKPIPNSAYLPAEVLDSQGLVKVRAS